MPEKQFLKNYVDIRIENAGFEEETSITILHMSCTACDYETKLLGSDNDLNEQRMKEIYRHHSNQIFINISTIIVYKGYFH